MTRDATNQNEPDSETQNDALDLEAAAMSQALEELTQLPPEARTTPRVKELLQSSDSPSRFMTVLSIVFGILAVTCFALLIGLYLKHRALQKKAAPIETASIVAPIITETLGEFKLFLNPEGRERIELRVDVVAECSNPEACQFLKEHLPQSRDVVLPVLSASSREELLSPDSKNLIRRKIAERLNAIPMPGKILQVHFSDLTIE